jgi:hypothetical protein
VTIDAADLALLRRFEPVVKYTFGELFFPTGVDGYLAECDLFVGASERERRLLVPQGELTAEKLVGFTAPPGENLYLRLVQKPLIGRDLARWNRRPDRPAFHAPGRLARVGLFARLVDAGFTASLLLRGTCPEARPPRPRSNTDEPEPPIRAMSITPASYGRTAGWSSTTCGSIS